MKTVSTTNHRIEVYREDIAKWFTSNKNDIDPTTLHLTEGVVGGPALILCVPISENYLDKFLQAKIEGLPKKGKYQLEILPHSKEISKEIVGVITWIK